MIKIQISLRNARNSDFEKTYRIKSKSIKPYVEEIWGWKESYQQENHKTNFIPLATQIIIYKQQEIGYIVTEETINEIYIENLLIEEEFQNLGIGNIVMANIIERANSEKKLIRLQVFKINKKAQRFYYNLGFGKTLVKDNHIVLEKNPV